MRYSCNSAGGSDTRPAGAGEAPGDRPIHVEERALGVHAVRFHALGCPCELLVHDSTPSLARTLAEAGAGEAWRIERKFSRYRPDSITSAINRLRGGSMIVDEETAGLLDFARHCYTLSDGLFDITSGVLRRVWKFDGSDRVPSAAAVEQQLHRVGFSKLRWDSPRLQLPEDMEIDFGGIGKEYAVDRAFALLVTLTRHPFLINFGGDLRASKPPAHGPWQIGVERPDHDGTSSLLLDLSSGALATSGDSHRFLVRDGVRYGHILDPRTGWPVVGSPRSVTVAAATCTEAGMWATLAQLQGGKAGAFLQTQGRSCWIID